MKTLHAGLCGALALALTFGACRDSSTGVMGGPRARSPSFATASDTGGGGGPGNQSHFMSNGDVGSVDWAGDSTATASDTGGGGGGGFTFGSLTVTRGGPTNDPETFLSYFIERCDQFFNCQFFEGSGLIPNRDLSGGGKSLQLSTNTAGNPNFSTFAGPPGLVSVRWNTNGFFAQRFSGTSEFRAPGFLQQNTGVSTSASANASGSVVGVAISPNNSASIGTSTNLSINIFH